MHYDEFLALFDRAHKDWALGRITATAAATEIERLRTVVQQLSPDDRADADDTLADFADEISPASRDRMARATGALRAAMAADGTIAEQIARAQDGIRAITRIGMETDNASERFAIINLNCALGSLIADLQDGLPPDQQAERGHG